MERAVSSSVVSASVRLKNTDLDQGYGIEINRRGYCLCPFHAEKTPSMHIMEKGYYCFGCGEGGDHIKFVRYTPLGKVDDPAGLAEAVGSGAYRINIIRDTGTPSLYFWKNTVGY